VTAPAGASPERRRYSTGRAFRWMLRGRMVRDGLRAALTEDAFGLAALRIAVVGVLLLSPELHAAKALAQSPELLVATPEGLGSLADLSFSPELVAAVRVVAITAGATALLGYWARLSCAVLGFAAAFLISFSQRTGAALHDMHLLWLLALLATSRCADVWALDGWGKGVPGPSLAYGVPLSFSRALLGVVYFFPGLHKLLSGGLAWGSADNLRAILYSKWFQHGQVPALRVDRFPDGLLTTAGTAVLSFEVAFVVLALWRPTRLVVLGLGLWFHLSTQAFFFIGFWGLLACYVVLIPWRDVRTRLSRGAPPPSWHAPISVWPSVLAGTLLLVVNGAQGVRGQTQAFPFACYPKFESVGPMVAPDLIVELARADRSVLRIERNFAHYRTQREWGRVYALLGAYGDPPTDEQLGRFAMERALAHGVGAELARAERVRFLAGEYSTRPEDWGKAPLRVQLLREFPPHR
jgi:hypothetical protein